MARPEPAPLILLDTHVAAWLYGGLLERLSAPAFDVIESGRLRLPGMAELELQYLHETGKLRPDAATVFSTLAPDIALPRRLVVTGSSVEARG